jgi:hypothetical protein
MPRRVSLPGAAELFRGTRARNDRRADVGPSGHRALDRSGNPCAGDGSAETDPANLDSLRAGTGQPQTGDRPGTFPSSSTGIDSQALAEPPVPVDETSDENRHGGTDSTGRVRHDEKITVYISSSELLSLERVRLALRAEHGTAVDRGRIVREALALALGDFSDRGSDSYLVGRLSSP